MNDNKTPSEPVEEERWALEEVPTIELVDEFRRRDDGVTCVIMEHGTFKNPWDEPIRVFVVPELSCTIIKPRLSHRIVHYMGTHRPPWWLYYLSIFASTISMILALTAIAMR